MSKQQNIPVLQISRKNYENIVKNRAVFIVKNALSKKWSDVIESCDRKVQIYCNKKGCTKITIEFKAACKTFKNNHGKMSFYAQLFNVVVSE